MEASSPVFDLLGSGVMEERSWMGVLLDHMAQLT
jgi:hypothetical protein